MAKRSKFKLNNGKSTGYAIAYFINDENWHLIRGLTKDNAKSCMRDLIKYLDVDDVAILHVEETWQRSFEDEAL